MLARMTVDITARAEPSSPASAATSRTWSASSPCPPTRPAPVRWSAAPRPTRDLFAAEGFDVDIVRAHDGAAGGDRQEGRSRGCPDGAALRPPRRAARERPRRLGLPAVRADRARRPPLRPRRRRRQGRHRRPPRRGAGLRRRPAGQRDDVHRGRGGGRLRHPRRAAHRPPGPPARPTSS